MRLFTKWSVLILALLFWSCGQDDIRHHVDGELTVIIDEGKFTSMSEKSVSDVDKAIAEINVNLEKVNATLQQTEEQHAQLDSILHPPKPKVDTAKELAEAKSKLRRLEWQMADMTKQLADIRNRPVVESRAAPALAAVAPATALAEVHPVIDPMVTDNEVFVFTCQDGYSLWGEPIGWKKSQHRSFDNNHTVSVPAQEAPMIRINGLANDNSYLDEGSSIQVSLYREGKHVKTITLNQSNILTQGKGADSYSNFIFRYTNGELSALMPDKKGSVKVVG